jgi:hypothetical protein
MKRKDSQDTRDKIMITAFELFGRYGFDGTSIREIANQSGVNVAAVNYHFTTKENLFWEIMAATYLELDLEIRDFARKSTTTKELALLTFDHFVNERFSLKNAIKMMLAEEISPPKSQEIEKIMYNPMGPPGGAHFAEKIQGEVPYTLSREGLLWGVKTVFGSVFHWGLMCCTSHVGEAVVVDPLMHPKQIRKDLEWQVESTLIFLKNNHQRFHES